MACTFDSPSLTSAVSGAAPTFGFYANNTNIFGIPATFTQANGKACVSVASATLYAGKEKETSYPCTYGSSSLTCALYNSAFPTGPVTLSYSASQGGKQATTFLVSATPTADTVFRTITSTSSLSPSAATTTTVTSYSATATVGVTKTVTSPATWSATAYVQSCAPSSRSSSASSASSAAPSSSSSSSIAPSTSAAPSSSAAQSSSSVGSSASSSGSVPSSSSSIVSSSSAPSSSSGSSSGSVSSAAASSSVASSSSVAPATSLSTVQSSSPTSSSAAPSATTLSCPGADGSVYTLPNGDRYAIECYFDRSGGDFNMVFTESLDSCIAACATTAGCVDVSWVPGSPTGPCYMKNQIVNGNSNGGVWGARSLQASTSQSSSVASPAAAAATPASSSLSQNSPVASSAAAAATPTSSSLSQSASITSPAAAATTPASPSLSQSSPVASSAAAAATPTSSSLSCPASDGTQYTAASGVKYQIECGVDHAGGDMPNSPVYVPNFETCIAACDSTAGCVDVAFAGAACYLKSSVGQAVSNGGVWGAVVISTPSAAASSASATSASAPASASPASATSTPASAAVGPASATSASAAPASTPAAATCPGADGTIFTTSCGAQYSIECYTDRYGGDFTARGTAGLEGCMAACDATQGCIDVSYVGDANNGECYMKNQINQGLSNSNVWGARKLSDCTASSNVKRAASLGGPDATYTAGQKIAASTATVTRTSTATFTPSATGTATFTATGRGTTTVTTTATATAYSTTTQTVTSTTCVASASTLSTSIRASSTTTLTVTVAPSSTKSAASSSTTSGGKRDD